MTTMNPGKMGRRIWSWMLIIFLAIPIAGQDDELPFYANGSYDEGIPIPDEVIGFPLGQRPVRHHEARAYFEALAAASPRVQLVDAGETYEGRALYHVLVGSQKNLSKVNQIKDELGQLADPRTTTSSQAENIANNSPAVAWMMYSIHGDELSGSDASMQVAYHLVAGNDDETKAIRDNVLVGIDPMENPDGRERYLSQMTAWSGNYRHDDNQSIHHSGSWPYGRTNHYLFDLNRDWFILAHPETRVRVAAIRDYHPQLVVDAHEMGSYDTYLFNPPREPINHHFNQITKRWEKTFTADQAKAFDQYGWSYYTREWLEDWYPGYGSSLPYLHGSVAILYEQASTDGSAIKRPDGTVLTYRQAVHHQFTSSIANITTLADNRKAILLDFYRMKKQSMQFEKDDHRAYYLTPGNNPARLEKLLKKLIWQGVEIHQATDNITVKSALSYWGETKQNMVLPKGTAVIRLNQPMRPLIEAILEFDPRMKTSFLQSERESLEKGKGTRLYEVSAWSMLLAYDLEAYVSSGKPPSSLEPFSPRELKGSVINPQPQYGFLLEANDDAFPKTLMTLLENGYKVRIAHEDFSIEGRSWSSGTALIRLHENPGHQLTSLQAIAKDAGLQFIGVNTGLSTSGPDLGGRRFQLLETPRIALIGGSGVSTYNFGTLWYLLDQELQIPFSILDMHRLSSLDLRRYNVLLMPSSSRYQQILGKSGMNKLKEWIKTGGTLIAMGDGAAFLADSSSAMSKIALKRQALNKLADYVEALDREQNIGKYSVDSLEIWESNDVAKIGSLASNSIPIEILKDLDARGRLFQPRGVIMRVNLDQTHWLNFGLGERLPVMFYSSNAFLAKRPLEVPARFANAEKLRLSGLLWPEARGRWANTVYAAREGIGNGQMILFADQTNFRSYFYGSGRMLINAMLLGPGFGSKPAVEF